EILWDVIDGVPHIGGAPFNFAAHVARCGMKSAIVSAVGDDALGRRALAEAERLGVDVSMVGVHPSLPTGMVNVTLADGIPSYEIVRPVAWDEIAGDAAAWGHAALSCNDGRAGSPLPAVDAPRAFYFGTLAQRSPVSAATLGRLLDACASSLVFFDVNLRQDYWSVELVEKGLAFTDILKVNDDEMRTLGFAPESLFARFPRLKTVVETRGAAGCRVTSRDGEAFDCPAISDGPVVDTIGAGDSFSAAFLAAVLRGGSLASAAEAGNRLAGKVAARAGAIPEDL
ncbi:MAG: carbohydrate kinase, partial [Kiritimatiellae bacterium]|nr:carbohydrate kinase [Kiritimatiellia bacterium]